MNSGASLFRYLGHGGGNVMAHEALFRASMRKDSDVHKLDNRRRLPFVPIYSCLTALFNYPMGPFRVCLSEDLLRRPEKGAIAVYGPSGKGNPQDHEYLDNIREGRVYLFCVRKQVLGLLSNNIPDRAGKLFENWRKEKDAEDSRIAKEAARKRK